MAEVWGRSRRPASERGAHAPIADLRDATAMIVATTLGQLLGAGKPAISPQDARVPKRREVRQLGLMGA